MSITKVLVLIVVLTLALVGLRYWSSEDDSGVIPAAAVAPGSSVSAGTQEFLDEAEPVHEVAEPVRTDEPTCLTLRQFEQTPEVVQDMARLEPLSVHGTAMSAYESLDEDTLRGFAEQGDSAAMAIIGAIYVLRAYDLDESLAIAWLNDDQTISDLDLGNSQLSSAASLSLNEAAYWFYESAMHGRLFALQNYGRSRGRLFGGPVGLGWVSQEEYDALNPSEKAALVPANLYTQVVFDIAPTLRKGSLGVLSRSVPQDPLHDMVRAELAMEFEQSLSDRGLPPTSEIPAASPVIESLLDRVCESEFEDWSPELAK